MTGIEEKKKKRKGQGLAQRIEFAKRMKSARIKIGLNQKSLAMKAKTTESAISQYESHARYPSSHMLKKIATALEVSTDFLLGITSSVELQDLLQNEKIKNIFIKFSNLWPQNQNSAINYIEFLISKQNLT